MMSQPAITPTDANARVRVFTRKTETTKGRARTITLFTQP